jgi:hypothetical protein
MAVEAELPMPRTKTRRGAVEVEEMTAVETAALTSSRSQACGRREKRSAQGSARMRKSESTHIAVGEDKHAGRLVGLASREGSVKRLPHLGTSKVGVHAVDVLGRLVE